MKDNKLHEELMINQGVITEKPVMTIEDSPPSDFVSYSQADESTIMQDTTILCPKCYKLSNFTFMDEDTITFKCHNCDTVNFNVIKTYDKPDIYREKKVSFITCGCNNTCEVIGKFGDLYLYKCKDCGLIALKQVKKRKGQVSKSELEHALKKVSSYNIKADNDELKKALNIVLSRSEIPFYQIEDKEFKKSIEKVITTLRLPQVTRQYMLTIKCNNEEKTKQGALKCGRAFPVFLSDMYKENSLRFVKLEEFKQSVKCPSCKKDIGLLNECLYIKPV